MFARRLPFQGGFAELITHHLMTVPKPPSTYAPVPAALDTVILACLEKDVAQRPQTAAELGRLLAARCRPTATPAAVFPSLPSAAVVTPVTAPDTLAPAPGRTLPDLTQLPAKDRRPLYVLAGLGGGGRGGRARAPGRAALTRGPVDRGGSADRHARRRGARAGRAPVAAWAASTSWSRTPTSASVIVDGKVVATGVREARVPGVAPGQPHRLRVEAPGRPPFERTFTVAADTEVELEAAMAPLPAAHPPGHPATERPHRREPWRPAQPGRASPATATASSATTSSTRSRPVLVQPAEAGVEQDLAVDQHQPRAEADADHFGGERPSTASAPAPCTPQMKSLRQPGHHVSSSRL